MKKAGIMTFHFADNYGAVLQAYALAITIEKLGIETKIIDFAPKRLRESYNLFPNIRNTTASKGLSFTIRSIISRLLHIRINSTRIRNFKEFRKTHLNKTEKKYKEAADLIRDELGFNYFITGSDQVWNPKFFSHVDGIYFLNFVGEESRKISYAASIAEKVDKSFHSYYVNNLATFDHISVRENSAKKFLESKIDKKIEITLDPTLLLSKKDWIRISTKRKYKYKYILVYDLISDPLVARITNELAIQKGYRVISYSRKDKYTNWCGTFFSCSPTEFLSLFDNAEYVVTNSFHGTAFSIIFNKLFYTIPHKTRGSRMIDLLNSLDISERIISREEDIKEIPDIIDYDKVNSKLLGLRKKSLDFLKKSLDVKDDCLD